nr:MAG TPA: hypothetical protein [Caudoviricetes sp.]
MFVGRRSKNVFYIRLLEYFLGYAKASELGSAQDIE